MSSRPGRARGVTLVELMIAMVIGLGLLVGVFKVFNDSRNAYAVSETAARLQETARYALSVIEPDVRMADYWGLYKGAAGIAGAASQAAAASAIGGNANVTCGNNFAVDLNRPLEGSNDT